MMNEIPDSVFREAVRKEIRKRPRSRSMKWSSPAISRKLTVMNQAVEKDRERLRQLETVVQRRFIEAGEALDEIWRKRLYRHDFMTFAAYCESRLGFKRQHAYRLIAAAKFARRLSPVGDKPVPQNERQARAAMEKVVLGEEPSTPTRRASNPIPVSAAGVTVGTLVARMPEFEPLLRHVPKDRLVTVVGWDTLKTPANVHGAGAVHTRHQAQEREATGVPALRPQTTARLVRDIPIPWSTDVPTRGPS